jgi:hypothetical protein
MEDRFFCPPASGKGPQSVDAADRIRLECHIVPRQNALHKRGVLLSCFDSGRDAFAGAGHHSDRCSDRRIGRIERMHFHRVLLRAVVGPSHPEIYGQGAELEIETIETHRFQIWTMHVETA